MREEFGVARSSCVCAKCSQFCEFMPGCLIPSDLARMIPAGANPYEWAENNLLASPGYVVMSQETGEVFRIGTLVPAVKTDGSCKFFVAGLCAIHENAPFGCAFFGCGCDESVAGPGCAAIYDAIRKPDELYFRLWAHLAYKGLIQPGPEVLRQRWQNQQKG